MPGPDRNDRDSRNRHDDALNDALEQLDLPAAPSLPSLSGPEAGIHRTPRLPTAGPDEIKLRLLKRDGKLLVHVTAPNPKLADAVVRKLFGPDQDYIIEMCG